MRIARFGDTYAGAYQFSDIGGSDEFASSRPVVAKSVALADGVYDFFGEDRFPLGAQVLPKKLEIVSSTFAGIDPLLSALKAATIGRGRTKLWRIWRDGATIQWCWAKCTDLRHGEVAGDNYFKMPVDLAFFNAAGKWYGTTENDVIAEGPWPSGQVAFSVVSYGETPALARLTSGVFDPVDDILYENLTTGQYCKITDGAGSNGTWIINSAAYSVYLDDGSPPMTPQYSLLEWNRETFFELAPGTNNVRITVGGAQDIYFHHLYWYDTYL